MPLIEFRNGRGVQERYLMQFGKRLRDIFIGPVDLADSIFGPAPRTC